MAPACVVPTFPKCFREDVQSPCGLACTFSILINERSDSTTRELNVNDLIFNNIVKLAEKTHELKCLMWPSTNQTVISSSMCSPK